MYFFIFKQIKIKNEQELLKFQTFIDINDICECTMIALPSPTAIENEDVLYHDDYYIQLVLTRTEGNFYDEKNTKLSKTPIANVHFKVFFIQIL